VEPEQRRNIDRAYQARSHQEAIQAEKERHMEMMGYLHTIRERLTGESG
jgi:hypothetical protein